MTNFVLEYAHYYRETPRYEVIGIFSSVELAENYLRSTMVIRGEDFIPYAYLKNARLKKEKDYYCYWYSDDGVVTSYRLKAHPVYVKESQFPAPKAVFECGGVRTTYSLKNGKTIKRNKIIA